MSLFSEYLAEIKVRRNLTCAQIAQMCNKNTKDVFCWIGGKYIPESWKQLEIIVDRLQLSEEEGEKLKNAYERTLIGEEKYACHRKIIEFFQVLQQVGDDYLQFQEQDIVNVREVKLPEFVQLNNKMEILRWIQNILDYLTSQKEKKLYLNIQVMNPEIMMLLNLFCTNTTNCKIEEIIYLKVEEKNAGEHNLQVLKGIAEVLVQRNSIEIYGQDEVNFEKGFSENWILSEDFICCFDEELSGGMLSTNTEWVQFFLDSFEDIKASGRNVGIKRYEESHGLPAFVFPYSDFIGRSIEYMPCTGCCLTRAMLEQYIYSTIPDREALIQGIMEYYARLTGAEELEWHTFFFREGMLEFMDTGRIDAVPDILYERPSVATRCEVLERMIDFSKEGKICYHMVKDGRLPLMKNLHVEQMNGVTKSLIIDMHFEDDRKERFEIEDEEFRTNFWNFFEYLEKGGYAYSVQETIAYMEEVLEEYRGRSGA